MLKAFCIRKGQSFLQFNFVFPSPFFLFSFFGTRKEKWTQRSPWACQLFTTTSQAVQVTFFLPVLIPLWGYIGTVVRAGSLTEVATPKKDSAESSKSFYTCLFVFSQGKAGCFSGSGVVLGKWESISHRKLLWAWQPWRDETRRPFWFNSFFKFQTNLYSLGHVSIHYSFVALQDTRRTFF